jgi:hypothetical protein
VGYHAVVSWHEDRKEPVGGIHQVLRSAPATPLLRAKADVEDYNDVSAVFRSTAVDETGRAHIRLDFLAEVGDPVTGKAIGATDACGEVGPPKSAVGFQDVPLSSLMLVSLKEWRLKSKFSGANDLIFPNKKRKYMCHDNLIKRRYKPTLKAAEVFDIILHSLRHYAVSTWIEGELALKTVQTSAGHSSLANRYGHLFPSDDYKAAMDAIAGELMG